MKYAVLTVLSLFAAILVIIPIPWHWRARNIPTLALMGWLFSVNVIYAVNTIVWNGTVENKIPVWCDITSKIRIGSQYAIAACILCLCRSLEFIAANRAVFVDRKSRFRWMIFDCCVCFLIPCIGMALHFIVQGHRFDILEDFGCQPTIYNSIPAIFIIFLPPLIMAFVAMGLAGSAFYHFFKLRLAFNEHLAKYSSALTAGRYIRLMGMSVVVILWNTALYLYNLILNVKLGLRPWTNWADVHSNWNRADQYPLAYATDAYIQNVVVYFCAVPVSSLVVFFFFGMGEEALKEYARLWKWIRRGIFRRRDVPSSSIKPSLSCYTYVSSFSSNSDD
ncbi:GPCR fungal pheromone mating factor [Vararia minispora EC-137]|uniref:GPCR fungal pheromone mating factor n=1 Tax=Vararia minispora EC-137 TaxID=1314806 RepID=A0ACB8QMZ9_9AGAM|nr:GPCR fungal pheromone mating factor [Vararia minispora EC-137]